MTFYCTNSSKATISIIAPEREVITSNNPPINIEVVSMRRTEEYEDYIHSMNQPINKVFEKPIADVQLNDSKNDWIFSGQFPPSDLRVHAKCPTLISRPEFSPSDTLHVEDKKLFSDFDSTNYSDNSGTCTYRIYFAIPEHNLIIRDNKGEVFQAKYNEKPQYAVGCGDECPPGYCKCECTNYPGYCCYDNNGNPLR